MEDILWKSADKLGGSVEPAEYKHIALSLFFLKFASDKFEARRQELIDEGQEQFFTMKLGYTTKTADAVHRIERRRIYAD
jgi:type I restriction enzyme M protein